MKDKIRAPIRKKNRDIYIKPFLVCLSITLIASMLMNVFVVASLIIFNKANEIVVSLASDVGIFVSLVIVPFCIYRKLFQVKNIMKIRWKKESILLSIIFLILTPFFPVTSVLHFFVIAIAEEIHFREFQYVFLKGKLNTFGAVIISSLIFAFVLHLNASPIENLVIRLPLGIIFCLIRYKFSLSKSIIVHWIYNLFIIYM